MNFDLYIDPGHAWLKVSKRNLRKLGIQNQISTYSYMKGAYAYLEEDVDMPLFIKSFQETYGQKVEFIEHSTDRQSVVRTYDSYEAQHG